MNDTIKLNKRQKAILAFLDSQQDASAKEIISFLEERFDHASKVTVLRDIRFLLDGQRIRSTGSGPSTRYQSTNTNPLLAVVDPSMMMEDINARSHTLFRFDVFEHLPEIFLLRKKEMISLNNTYQHNRSQLGPDAIRRELTRITVEFSWKSSRIEGNTYSLIDTEMLLQNNQPASGHTEAETQMILNHKVALDFVLSDPTRFVQITPQHIRELHTLLVADLSIETGIRTHPVGIIGTTYQPLDNEHQIGEAIERLCEVINESTWALEKAMIAVAMISYIQPFVDGNKRTARLLANAILLAHDWCPLSYRSVDEAEYKKKLIVFYEQLSLRDFAELFVSQYRFAVHEYFQVSNTKSH